MPHHSELHPAVRYKRVAGLLKPPRRTVARALPSALHIGGTGTLSILVFGIINVAVTYSLGHKNKWSKLVQQGTQMAMITVTLLAMPNLGKSVTKGVQRIAGVMAGGWLFYALYASCQLWWFLAVCLAVWAFFLVSMSFLLTGQQFLSPVALITAFVVATNFNTVEQAYVNTVVKTVAISGAIVFYTLVSMLLFPVTATQQLVGSLSDVLSALHELSDVLLLKGQSNSAAAEGAAHDTDKKAVEDDAAASAATPAQAAASNPAAKGTAAPEAANGTAERLAATATYHLQMVSQLLPAAQKERFMGNCGSHRCFVPSASGDGIDDSIVNAVSFSASQVLRALLMFMEEFGNSAVVHCAAPASLITPAEHRLLHLMASAAVAALQDLCDALPATGAPRSAVITSNLSVFGEKLQELIAASLNRAYVSEGISQHSSESTGQAVPDSAAAGPASRWKATAAAALGKPTLFSGGTGNPTQIAAAFQQLLTDAVLTEQAQTTRWCTMLVLSRQLGKSITALTQSMNKLLQVLPGAASVHKRLDKVAADCENASV